MYSFLASFPEKIAKSHFPPESRLYPGIYLTARSKRLHSLTPRAPITSRLATFLPAYTVKSRTNFLLSLIIRFPAFFTDYPLDETNEISAVTLSRRVGQRKEDPPRERTSKNIYNINLLFLATRRWEGGSKGSQLDFFLASLVALWIFHLTLKGDASVPSRRDDTIVENANVATHVLTRQPLFSLVFFAVCFLLSEETEIKWFNPIRASIPKLSNLTLNYYVVQWTKVSEMYSMGKTED